jgi:hypothetical protein
MSFVVISFVIIHCPQINIEDWKRRIFSRT